MTESQYQTLVEQNTQLRELLVDIQVKVARIEGAQTRADRDVVLLWEAQNRIDADIRKTNLIVESLRTKIGVWITGAVTVASGMATMVVKFL